MHRKLATALTAALAACLTASHTTALSQTQTAALNALTQTQTPTLEWVRQLGTSEHDTGASIAVDNSGNTYLSGRTLGSLSGVNAGSYDTFLAKYDAAGNLSWTRQLGSASRDMGESVAVDAAGNAYVSGWTEGRLGVSAGQTDAFLAKYDAAGNLAWTRQLGTASHDQSRAVAVDAGGNAYISGFTGGSFGVRAGSTDAFLAKYDTAGNLAWTKQLGTSGSDYGLSVAVESTVNALFISGYTRGAFEGVNSGINDAFLAKYDMAGNLAWTRQLGTSGIDNSHGVAVDAMGNAYISGITQGSLGGASTGNDYDAFLAKYDPAGNLSWTRQLGSGRGDYSQSVAVDAAGNAFITGYTESALDGVNAGEADAFVALYDAAGNLVWTKQLGTANFDQSDSIALDTVGNFYIGGTTLGAFDGVNAGTADAFLAKYKYAVPEPGSLTLLALGGLGLMRRKRHRIAKNMCC